MLNDGKNYILSLNSWKFRPEQIMVNLTRVTQNFQSWGLEVVTAT